MAPGFPAAWDTCVCVPPPPVIDEIVQAPLPKPAADPFQLTPEQKDQARQTIVTVASEDADKLTREEKITALKYLRGKSKVTSGERKRR